MTKPKGQRHLYAAQHVNPGTDDDVDVYPCERPGCSAALGMVRWQDGRSVNLRRYRAKPVDPWATKIPPCPST